MALRDYERYPLTFGPSPVHQLQRLSDHLGAGKIWAKREDVNSGLAFGGNKTRKMEYIVPDILASGADALVSIGGYQSNHTRQVAAIAAHLGLQARLVQERWLDWDDPVNDKVGNIELSRILGADVRLDPAGFDIGIRSSWENAIAELEGVILDPVYEGKSMAGLIDLAEAGEFAKDSNILYAHLGGQLALNAYSSIFD